MITMSEAIDDYKARDWSIIPIRPGDKRPLVRWEEYQHRCPSQEEARSWLRAWPEAGVAIVTGAISGLVVLDIDLRHGGDAALAPSRPSMDAFPQPSSAGQVEAAAISTSHILECSPATRLGWRQVSTSAETAATL
jgi:Bifunctional DNA primase/polymerase, N-terminal